MKPLLTLFAIFPLFVPDAVLANEVEAEIRGRNLYVYGDGDANSLAISSPMEGQIQVSGFSNVDGDPTVVNGTDNGTVVLEGWSGAVYVYLYDGNDDLTLFGIRVPGVTHIDLGDGDDQLYVGTTVAAVATLLSSPLVAGVADPSVELQSVFRVIGANGDDFVEINDTLVIGRATLNLGNGEDSLFGGSAGQPDMEGTTTMVEFQDTLVVLPGSNADVAQFGGVLVAGNFVFDDTNGALDLTIADTTVQQNLSVFGTPSSDSVVLTNVMTTDNLLVITENGNDTISLNGEAMDVKVDGGGGNDSLEFQAFTADRMRSFLGGGADTLMVSESDFARVYGYGSAGNDEFQFGLTTAGQVWLYGHGGNDTLTQAGNTFGTLKLYSIENQ